MKKSGTDEIERLVKHAKQLIENEMRAALLGSPPNILTSTMTEKPGSGSLTAAQVLEHQRKIEREISQIMAQSFREPPYRDWNPEPTSHLPGPFTVSDIERLAKAGVAVDFKQLTERGLVMPDRIEPRLPVAPGHNLVEALVQRWRLANTTDQYMFIDGNLPPFMFACAVHGDKVHVFVAPTQHNSFEPLVLHDERACFPSDALLAKLNLLLTTKQTISDVETCPSGPPGHSHAHSGYRGV